MKRKVGISLGHLRMPKVETQDLEDRLSKVYSPPSSPLICRRPLSPATEAELRTACAAIAKDYEPTEEEIRERKLLESRAAHVAKPQRTDAARKQQQSRHAGASSDKHPAAALHSARQAHRTSTTRNDVVQESTHPRKPPATAHGESQPELRQLRVTSTAHPQRRSSLLPPPPEVTAAQAAVSEAQYPAAAYRQSCDSVTSTVRSASTDFRAGQPSTDLTSAARSPQRSSKHNSRSTMPIDAVPGPRTHPLSDAWFYREYKRDTPPELSRPDSGHLQAVRKESRSGKPRDSIGGYVRSSWSNNSTVSLGRRSRPTSQIWKSWNPAKWASQPDLTDLRETSSRFEVEQGPQARKSKQPDLNRELPPLPGLDQWREPEEKPRNHIAALMKGQHGTGAQKQASKNNTAAFMSMPDLNSGKDLVVTQAVTLRAFIGSRTAPQRPSQENASRTLDHLTGQKDAYDRYVGNVARQRVDSPQQQHRGSGNGEAGSDETMEVTALPAVPPTSQGSTAPRASEEVKKGGTSGLGRILGRFGRSRAGTKSKPSKADGNWMNQIEAQGGVKGAILEIDEAAGAPVIRY